jgi:hypothetical protein
MPSKTTDAERLTQYKSEYTNILRHGFLPFEASSFICARTPDGEYQNFDAVYNSDVFKKTLESRAKWVVRLNAMQYDRDQIAEEIKHFYNLEGERESFSFVKAEYDVATRNPTDYEFAVKMRARTQIGRMSGRYGIRYHRPLKKSWRPIEPLQPGPGHPAVT